MSKNFSKDDQYPEESQTPRRTHETSGQRTFDGASGGPYLDHLYLRLTNLNFPGGRKVVLQRRQQECLGLSAGRSVDTTFQKWSKTLLQLGSLSNYGRIYIEFVRTLVNLVQTQYLMRPIYRSRFIRDRTRDVNSKIIFVSLRG